MTPIYDRSHASERTTDHRRVSIIIPLFNEESTLPTLLTQLEPIRNRCEILFVDGGSSDGTIDLIPQHMRVISASKGRGHQMNVGAENSVGDILFFLHCDSELPPDALTEIEEVMDSHRFGCFGIDFGSKNPIMYLCQLISQHRCRFRHIIFGDQGLFIDRDLFFEIGCFPEIPLMEDYQLSLTLKKRRITPGFTARKLKTSTRRFPDGNVAKLRTMFSMVHLRARYRKGTSVEELAARYRDIR